MAKDFNTAGEESQITIANCAPSKKHGGHMASSRDNFEDIMMFH
jgi:hypothetical protein